MSLSHTAILASWLTCRTSGRTDALISGPPLISDASRELPPCRIQTAAPITAMRSTRSTANRRRQSGRRTTTGCLCCRLRHKKCDEVKPTCGGCWRNSLICSWSLQDNSNQRLTDFRWRKRLLSGSDHVSQTVTDADDMARRKIETKNQELQQPGSPSQADLGEEDEIGFQLPEVDSQWYSATAPLHTQKKLSPSINPGHLILRDSNTRTLFLHYAAETAGPLCTRTDAENPFVTYVLPRAYSDSLIMSAMIALSGVHFCHKIPNPDMLCTTWSNYAQAVRGLKHELTRMNGDEASLVRLLFVTILLCHVECVSGNSDGAIFHHLRASRHFVLSLMTRVKEYSGKDECAFLIEVYSYLASISNITFNSTSEKRATTYDASIYSVDSWKGSKTYGVMFGCASDLFELIPQVCQFGRDRFLEEADANSLSVNAIKRYKAFETQIRDWKIPTDFNEKDAIPGSRSVAYIYQEALLIYLYAGFYASDITNPKFRQKVDDSVAKIIPLIESIPHVSPGTAVWSTLLWPFMIVGSCLLSPERRQCLYQTYKQAPGNMAIMTRALQLLEWMWEEDSDSVFGPNGLEMVMNRRKVNFCMG